MKTFLVSSLVSLVILMVVSFVSGENNAVRRPMKRYNDVQVPSVGRRHTSRPIAPSHGVDGKRRGVGAVPRVAWAPSHYGGPQYENEDGHIVYHRHFHVYNHDGDDVELAAALGNGGCDYTPCETKKEQQACDAHGLGKYFSKSPHSSITSGCGGGTVKWFCCKNNLGG